MSIEQWPTWKARCVEMQTKRQQIILFFLCSIFSISHAHAYQKWPVSLTPQLQVGLMGGYTGGPRRGLIVNPVNSGSVTNSGSQDSSEIGVQMSLLFGSECCYRPFIYLNGAKSIGAPLSILLGKVLAPFTNTTKLAFTTNWLTRLGIGVTTPWLYDRFQLGAGVGAVMLNQTLETYLGQVTTTSFQQTNTSIRPSLMSNVTWSLCPLLGHQTLLTAEITADHQPAFNDNNVPSNIGTLHSSVTQAWVFRGDLIFSISLG